jgi:methionyl aminopeptidase
MIVCKSPAEIERMRAANEVVAAVLTDMRDAIAPGISTGELDERAEAKIRAAGATPAFKGYHGYPAALCVSINDEVIHGIPSRKRLLNEGDIVSVDVGATLDGFVGDSAVTFPVGAISERAALLLRVTQESLYRAIVAVKVGGRVSDIGHAVQQHVEAHGCSVVREFVGHGIGIAMHEEPQVPNYGPSGHGARLTEGMVLAIEPMVNLGRPAVRVLEDGWTAVTRDHSLSAHFEHTVAVTKEGPLVLTARGDERFDEVLASAGLATPCGVETRWRKRTRLK